MSNKPNKPNKQERRDLNFYMEVVIITIASLLAANLWTHFIREFLDHYYPHNLSIWLLAAVIVTIASIYLLHTLFGESSISRNSPLDMWTVKKDKHQKE